MSHSLASSEISRIQIFYNFLKLQSRAKLKCIILRENSASQKVLHAFPYSPPMYSNHSEITHSQISLLYAPWYQQNLLIIGIPQESHPGTPRKCSKKCSNSTRLKFCWYQGAYALGPQSMQQDLDGEIENSGKSIFEIRIPNFCYIQVIVFDLSYLPVAAFGTQQVRYHQKIVT